MDRREEEERAKAREKLAADHEAKTALYVEAENNPRSRRDDVINLKEDAKDASAKLDDFDEQTTNLQAFPGQKAPF